jgi:hypothetical protein
VLIKSGKPVAVEEDIVHTDVSYLYIFKNTDPGVERNPSVPLYEATFYCADRGGYHVRAQKCHLKRIYAQCGHTNRQLAWNVDEITGVPYWVDRYAFSRMK